MTSTSKNVASLLKRRLVVSESDNEQRSLLSRSNRSIRWGNVAAITRQNIIEDVISRRIAATFVRFIIVHWVEAVDVEIEDGRY